jgi:hypothetical protein
MNSASDFIGEFVKKEGQESRHWCNVCGTKALMVSEEKRVWFCHGCSIGGRTTEQDTAQYIVPSPKAGHFDVQGWIDLAYPIKESIRGITVESWDLIGAKTKPGNGLLVPTTLKGKCIGLQWYNPVGTPRYRTMGPCGVVDYDPQQSVDYLVLFEGLFDFMSVLQWQEQSNPTNQKLRLMYFLGNSLSDAQFAELYSAAHRAHIILIAFDNDKVRPVMVLLMKLRALFPRKRIELMLPPQFNDVKDWDDMRTKYSYEFNMEMNKRLA